MGNSKSKKKNNNEKVSEEPKYTKKPTETKEKAISEEKSSSEEVVTKPTKRTKDNNSTKEVGKGGSAGKAKRNGTRKRKNGSKGGTKKNKPKSNSSNKNEDEFDFGDDIVNSQQKKVTQEDFELLTVIGRGSFGKVMQVKHKETGKIYAMKVMRKDAIIAKNQVKHTRDEKSILQKIQHPFIVNLRFAFQTKDKLYMILDYVNGGELFFHLKKNGKFSEDRVIFYAAEISSALSHLHSHGIVYRDLKPENILLDMDGHIVITDFGLSKEVPTSDSTHTFCGTPEYLAPEVLRGQGHSYPVDWWSLGTLIYEMLTGLPPFYSKHINVMYQKILNAQLTFPSSMSSQAQSLLEGLLTRDSEARLSGDGVKKHPFFKGINWDDLEAKKIDAPWKPPVETLTDTTQIDDFFKSEKPIHSVVDGSLLDDLDDDDKDIFAGFTFAGGTVLDGNDSCSS